MGSVSKVPAFGLLPEEITTGARPGGRHVFGRIQRVHEWVDGAPALGARAAEIVAGLDLSLPEVCSMHPSDDGATKLGLRLGDGRIVEAVHMPRDVRRPRVTICISSQVGCGMGCTFCATAQMGFVRNLSAHEIVGQVMRALLELGPEDPRKITLVFMGMGEPLHNTTEVLRAVEVLCHDAGLGLAPSRITVSTSGLVPQIAELAQARVRPQLAVSLNATTDDARARTMPIAKKHGLAELARAIGDWPLRPHEKVTLAYVLLRGENDTDGDAERLAAFAGALPRAVVNVIPYNAFEGTSYAEADAERLARFTEILHAAGCLVTVRRSRGRDVAAACGQLAREGQRPSGAERRGRLQVVRSS